MPPGFRAGETSTTISGNGYSGSGYYRGGYSGGGYYRGGYSGGGYSGGGYSGGGYSSGGGTAAATGWAGLPTAWIEAFTKAFRLSPETYYTAERGGADQAAKDYQSFVNIWQGRTNRPMSPEDMVKVMTGFEAYVAQLGREPTWDDLMSYLDLILTEPAEPPAVSYLKMSEI